MDRTHHHLASVITDASNGTLSGPDQLVNAFYPELKRLAAAKMRRESSDHTWQPTVLVNELYLELVKVKTLRPVRPNDQAERSAFFALASQVMHWLLIRHARPLSWQAEMQELPASLAHGMQGAEALAQIDDLLNKLGAIDGQLRRVVELRVFEGLSTEEAALRMGCSTRTVARHWRFAKVWLQDRLG